MNPFKIVKRIRFIKELELKIIRTQTSIEMIHQNFLKPYSKKKALELDELSFRLCLYLRTLNRIHKL